MSEIRTRRSFEDVDSGFTLIEVIVALMLMSIVLMAGGGFMIRSLTTSSALDGRQGAVSVANQVMEQVRAVDPTLDATKTSPLVYGRIKADVVTQWAAGATAGLDVSDTYTGSGSTTFDSAAYATAGTVTLPLQQTISSGSQAYTVDTLIGTCVRADGLVDCDKSALGDELYRVVVRVTWAPGVGRTCSGKPCAYVISTLIDPTVNPVFNASRKPLAKNDSATTPSGTAVDIGIIANDSGDFAPVGAVTIVTGPANGTYVVSNNIISYTPTAGFSGTNTFTYTVTDLTSRTSNVATVTIKVTPVGVNDVGSTVTAGSSAVLIDVLANDRGTGLSLVSPGTASIGSAVISGGKISYTAPSAASGVATIVYTAKDSAAQQYNATLTVTVRPTSTAICWAGWATSSTGSQTRSVTIAASSFVGTGSFTVGSPALVSPSPTGASVTVSGTTLTYILPKSGPVPQSITYVVSDASGIASTAVTMTLKGSCP